MKNSLTAANSVSIRVSVAVYQKVKDYLKVGLSQGQWLPGSLMPSESDLVARFGVSRMTVNRALRELQSEGLVDRVQGVGTFAAQLNRVSSQLTIRDLHEEIETRGHSHHAKVLLVREEKASARLAEQMGIALNAKVFHSVVIHHDNGLAMQCEDRYVNPAWAPDYLGVDFTTITPTAYLLKVAPLWQAQYTIQAGQPTKQEAKWLGIDPSTACLVVVRRTISRGLPITLARLVHPGSVYQLEGQFSP
jgi:GntR family transcriptional regulator, histidine utilization repressor